MACSLSCTTSCAEFVARPNSIQMFKRREILPLSRRTGEGRGEGPQTWNHPAPADAAAVSHSRDAVPAFATIAKDSRSNFPGQRREAIGDSKSASPKFLVQRATGPVPDHVFVVPEIRDQNHPVPQPAWLRDNRNRDRIGWRFVAGGIYTRPAVVNAATATVVFPPRWIVSVKPAPVRWTWFFVKLKSLRLQLLIFCGTTVDGTALTPALSHPMGEGELRPVADYLIALLVKDTFAF